jgi:cytosine deaminase
MYSDMILLYKISKVVIGENETLKGPEEYLIKNGVELVNLNLDECKAIMNKYIEDNPEIWGSELEKVGF